MTWIFFLFKTYTISIWQVNIKVSFIKKTLKFMKVMTVNIKVYLLSFLFPFFLFNLFSFPFFLSLFSGRKFDGDRPHSCYRADLCRMPTRGRLRHPMDHDRVRVPALLTCFSIVGSASGFRPCLVQKVFFHFLLIPLQNMY